MAFATFLHRVVGVGGTTIKDYLQRLPTALALHHSNFESAHKQFALDPAVKTALGTMAVEIPPVRRTVRDPVTVDTVVRVNDDPELTADTRAAIVLAFYLGFRPINLVSVKRSRAVGQEGDRPLRWADIRTVNVDGVRGYEVTVRKEKTAAAHSGDYAPKLLLPAQPGMPCPVTALDAMGFRYGMRRDAPLFPFTRDTDLQTALQKHAAPGQRLTPYSLRIGKATQMAAAGLPMEHQRRAGNWASNKTADKYVRNSKQTWARTQKALAATRGSKAQQPKSRGRRAAQKQHAPALRSGHARTYPDGKTDMLLVRSTAGRWKGYFYDPATGKRAQRPRARKPAVLADFEPFLHTEIEYMLRHTRPKQTAVIGQMLVDSHAIRAALDAHEDFPERPDEAAGEHDNDGDEPAAAGGGGD